MPEVPARWLAPLEGRRPAEDEVLQCLRRGSHFDGAHWSDAQFRQVMDSLKEPLKKTVSGHASRALWLRVPLVPARSVRILARPLEVLTKGWTLVGLLVLGMAVPLLPLAREGFGILSSGDWLAAAALFFTGAMLHELGHAAALSAQGYPAGGIGAGLLFVIPVLHNDVSAISQLPTRGKLRVDLAGVALQVAYGALLLLIASGPGREIPAWHLAGRLSYFAVGWSLIPFIRADGYWALCDVFGFQDLDRPFEGVVSRSRLVFLLVHRVLNIAFLIFIAVILPVTWAGRLTAALPEGLGSLASVVVPGLILLLWGAMGRRIFKLVGMLVLDIRLFSRGGFH